ncbi:hypothetical protein B0T25DRAFT_616777 [Lasiosphaeria hispida]|uniref:Cell cycle inhibitor Nif1 n=1 Tax=Lasiosphaeria hispida TaxID=260671 RepID=A0AAJ0M8I9_9PEZI|nr:hypothetical protein B0T25DRAFT_616777 [Lasiosphaeria hispida]
MATPKPTFLDLRSKSQASVSRPLRSPRLHIAGEAPPEVSPLEALKIQSQLLARRLEEESAKNGRRMSRLPPLTTESPLIVQGRSDYFRSMSHESGDEDGDALASPILGLGLRTEVEDDYANRPVSVHPRMSRIPPTPDQPVPMPTRPNMDTLRRELSNNTDGGENYFGARREQSPVPLERIHTNPNSGRLQLSRSGTQESNPQQSPVSNYSMASSPEKLYKMNSFEVGGLLPPRPSFSKRSSSILSSLESTDGDALSSLSTSIHSQSARKFSNSSGVLSPTHSSFPRSPSISSDTSGLIRPSFNFSRPLSRAGTPSLDPPIRQSSSDSQASFLLGDDTAHTPISMTGEGFPDANSDEPLAAPSYIYSKFSLPRGKILQRSSAILLDDFPGAQFTFQQPPTIPPSNVKTFPIGGQPPPSPPTRPSSSAGARMLDESLSRPSIEPSKLSIELARPTQQPSPDPSRPSTEGARLSEESPRGRQPISPHHQTPPRGRTAVSTATSDSASTIKASRSLYSTNAPTMSDISAEEHVSKAVELHENGSLQESTWHLRHAARQGHPTGMLLYALACRHGWGMRANQREGVEWLRKAAESASLEIADDEGQAKEGKAIDVLEHKTRKAQFALSIYELGVSHMNGWGIEQDKALALRCFEIAGAWGDVDALAEAGFCYAQGVGCKKNLMKSAKFYREAEAKGMSMVGNSWIHKPKYNDDGKDSPDSKKKSRSKSRSRKGLFSRRAKA